MRQFFMTGFGLSKIDLLLKFIDYCRSIEKQKENKALYNINARLILMA